MKSDSEQQASSESSGPLMTDEGLTERAVRFLLTMLASASTEKIDPRDWWDRARSALETGATSDDWPRMVSRIGKKLQIDSLTEASSVSVSEIGADLADTYSFRRFRAICKRDALYITAMAQARRAEQKRKAGRR